MTQKYVILRLEDAQALSSHVQEASASPRTMLVAERLKKEEGGDILDIAQQLKDTEFCGACIHEGRERYCTSLDAQKLGRRLRRLVERADHSLPPDPNAKKEPVEYAVVESRHQLALRTATNGHMRSALELIAKTSLLIDVIQPRLAVDNPWLVSVLEAIEGVRGSHRKLNAALFVMDGHQKFKKE